MLSIRADAQRKLGNLEAAENRYVEALAMDPRFDDASIGLALLAVERAEVAKAMSIIDSVLSESNDNSHAWLVKGDLDLSQEKFELAVASYQKAMDLAPGDRQGPFGMAYALLGLEQNERAREIINRLRTDYPNDLSIEHLHALALSRAGDDEAAREVLRNILKKNPRLAASQRLIGTIQHRLGEYEQAITHLGNFLSQYPSGAAARLILIDSYWRLGERHQIITLVKDGVRESPDNAQLHMLLADFYAANGNQTKAAEHYQIASSLEPESSAYRGRPGSSMVCKMAPSTYRRNICVSSRPSTRTFDYTFAIPSPERRTCWGRTITTRHV